MPIFEDGKLVYGVPPLADSKKYTMQQISHLPTILRDIFDEHKLPVEMSKKIQELLDKVKEEHVQREDSL